MKIILDKEKFLKDSQRAYCSPQFNELRDGNVGAWIAAVLFFLAFGWIYYPLIALDHTYIKFNE